MITDRHIKVASARGKINDSITQINSVIKELKAETPIGKEGNGNRVTLHFLETALENLKVCNSELLTAEYRL